MDLNPLIDNLVSAIATDSAIDAWCRDNYGRGIKVFGNFDVRNPPGEEDCPAVCVYPEEKQYGGRQYADAVTLVDMVHDPETRNRPGLDNVIEYAGVKNVEALRRLVLEAAVSVVEQSDTAGINEIAVDYSTIEWFPFCMAGQTLSIESPYVIGSGHPARNE